MKSGLPVPTDSNAAEQLYLNKVQQSAGHKEMGRGHVDRVKDDQPGQMESDTSSEDYERGTDAAQAVDDLTPM